MISRRHLSTAVLIILLVIFLLIGGIEWKNGFLVILNGIWKKIGWPSNLELEDLRLENVALRAQVLELTNNIAPFKSDTIGGKIFSSYPFNNKNLLSINIGSERGIREGMPATVSGQILVGQVIQVFKNYSLIRTIFSPNWEIPVRIGNKKVPALLVGGPELKLTMIVNDKPIFDGQTIFAAKQDLPYGLKIGEVVNVQNDIATGVFKEARVKLDYDLNDLSEILIALWTAD